jgi:hypothetical protein
MQGRIPNQFHFVFGLKKQQEPFHLMFYICIESCLRVNNPDKIFFYYYYEPYGRYWDLVREKITPVRIDLPAYEEIVRSLKGIGDYPASCYYTLMADWVRLEKLVEHGGIYADMDTLFVNKVPAELRNNPFVLGREIDMYDPHTRQSSSPALGNSMMMSEKNAEFGKIWLREMASAFHGGWSDHSTVLPYELSQKYPDLVHVEPQRSFFHHSYKPENLYTLFQGCDPNYDGIISMHLWSTLWWSRWRRDFSNFHAGKLTENHIRKVDTTYNLIARRYLPPESQDGKLPIFSGIWKKRTKAGIPTHQEFR